MENIEEELNVKLVNQDELESSITKKASAALAAKEQELDEKRLEKTKAELDKTRRKIRSLESRLGSSRTKISQRKLLRDEIEWFRENELQPLLQDVADIESRIKGAQKELKEGSIAMEGELERDFLIRTGKITAFGSSSGFTTGENGPGSQSRVNLRAPGFADHVESPEVSKSVVKEEKIDKVPEPVESRPEFKEDPASPDLNDSAGDDEYVEDEAAMSDVSEGLAAEDDLQIANDLGSEVDSEATPEPSTLRNGDDGDEDAYQARLADWVLRRAAQRAEQASKSENGEKKDDNTGDLPEWQMPHPSIPDAVLNSEFRLPGDIFPSLFDYQKTCVQWLWELYTQKTGGIIGDEMGLGKTIQVIAFLAGLHYLGLLHKPVLLVVPATVMNQWVNEFHRWWPPFRCVILHSIGAGMNKALVKSEEQLEQHLEAEFGDLDSLFDKNLSLRLASNQKNAREIVDRVMAHGHVLVTTYVGLRIYSKHILPREWGYVVLDEGHKIRNPNSEISLACKRVKTYNRVILSGTPIQNNLVELWSLFDFVFPGRLGTLPVFEQQFAVPINMGGYANASNVQVQTGYNCAVILRDLISPYLLRRLKVDVAQDLPQKNEMVLFVRLTQYQQDLYERFLGSEDVGAILKGRRNVLMGVDTLRKICNHPDLIDRDALLKRKGYNYGNPVLLGKMQVLKNLLQLWQSQGHRTLLFCQTKQMLDILEKFLANLPCLNDELRFNYLRMDGSTPISKRQLLVDLFNTQEYYHVFLLTTKVGGLGVNLTGADRVIIYDPDWNPSTDMQARERAWRLGQKKDITIYRLMTAGTIEEKIYHRQIFKTFLTNKILKDPKQRRFFKLNDLHDLFSLGDPDEKGTETGDMFNGSEQTFGGAKARKSRLLLRKQHKNDDDLYEVAKILGVLKLDKFLGEEEKELDSGNKDDNRIMEGLLSNAGILHSTLKHDDIVDSSQHEVSLVEVEANKVAKEAAEALRRSRISTRKNAVGVPTWTGKFGAAGRFGMRTKRKIIKSPEGSEREESPLSSLAILSDLRRSGAAPQALPFGRKRKRTEAPKTGSDREALLKTMVDFLNTQPGAFSRSEKILSALPKSVDVNNEREMVMVRSLLKEAAEWQSNEKGWKLKKAFQESE